MSDVAAAARQLVKLAYEGDARREEVGTLLDLLGHARDPLGASVDAEDMIIAVRDSGQKELTEVVRQIATNVAESVEWRRAAASILADATLWGAIARRKAEAEAGSNPVSLLDAITRYPPEVALADVGALQEVSAGPCESLARQARATLRQLRVNGVIP